MSEEEAGAPRPPRPPRPLRSPRPESGGTRFRLRADRASAVDLCLFAPTGEETRLPLEPEHGEHGVIWRRDVDGVRAGQRYGYRVDGPWEPRAGHRFNPHKLLLDPYALAVDGQVSWCGSVYGYGRGGPFGTERSRSDSAAAVPRSVLVEPSSLPGRPSRPRTPWSSTVIYEAHVRGLTRLHPAVPERLRGTYLGLAEPAVLDHLLGLGTTAVQLMPVQQSASESHLARWGRTNYWGYSPLAWFAPHAAYATGSDGAQVAEFRAMVDALHAAGLEVLLDVVFNHTVEDGERGPTLCLRGLDNATYYRHATKDGVSRTVDYTGCGNTLDFSEPQVVELVVDCLRYWVEAMGVDGFRFDLGTVLGRDPEGFDPEALFFRRVAAEPALRDVKLIAEPWDLGRDGYALGRFPAGWAQWNDRFRDAARSAFCLGTFDPRELDRRLAGSPDLLADPVSTPSIDFVTCHDGFTLRDLVSYRHKVNWANGEDNRDGSSHDRSTNCGCEGPSAEPAVLACRARAQRNLLAMLALTRGVPMLSHGDELGRTQGGNNNAYCQDNRTSWVDWRASPESAALCGWVERLFALRRRWQREIGNRLPKRLACAGDGVVAQWASERRGASAVDWLWVLNPSSVACEIELPEGNGEANGWVWLLDTAGEENAPADSSRRSVAGVIQVPERAVVVLRRGAPH